MKNISMSKLMQMRVVWPPKETQQTFSKALREVLELSNSKQGGWISTLLKASLSAHAFTGQLTEEWREANQQKLANEARDRDAAFGAAVAVKAAPREIKSFMFAPNTLEELNEEQHLLYNHIQRMRRPEQITKMGGKRLPEYFTADLFQRMRRPEQITKMGGKRLPEYFTADLLAQKLGFAPFTGNSALIAGHLAVLAARGALIPVSREEQAKDTGEYVFGNAYRLYRNDKHELLGTEQEETITTEKGEGIIANTIPGDRARRRELQRLAARLEKERMLP